MLRISSRLLCWSVLLLTASPFAFAAAPQNKAIAKVFGRAITEEQLTAETNRLIKIEIQRGALQPHKVDFDVLQEKQNIALLNLMKLELKRYFLAQRKITISPEELERDIKYRDEETQIGRASCRERV